MGIDLNAENPDRYTRVPLQSQRRSPSPRQRSNATTFARVSRRAEPRGSGMVNHRSGSTSVLRGISPRMPNEDYDTAVVIIDELDKGTSKRELARRAGITWTRVRAIDDNQD